MLQYLMPSERRTNTADLMGSFKPELSLLSLSVQAIGASGNAMIMPATAVKTQYNKGTTPKS